eukprot:COSAG06_NODE_399_length_16207_cov_61.131984_7_plen_355_part_00
MSTVSAQLDSPGRRDAVELQRKAAMAVNLMAIGLSATADDAEDVKLSLLRALRDQGFSREAAQKIGSTAIATGDRFLTEEWARYTTGATDLMVQKLGLAIDDVRAQQGRTGLQRLPPRQEEDEADRAARQLADIDLDELLSSDEDDAPEPAAAATPQLAPGAASSAPFTPASEPPGTASKPLRPARSAAVSAQQTAPPTPVRTLTLPSPAASAPPATPVTARPAPTPTPARPARPGASDATIAALRADVTEALNRGMLRDPAEAEKLLDALQDNPMTAALYQQGTLAAQDLIQPGYADSMEKRLRDRAASQQGQRARTMSARRAATLPVPRQLPTAGNTGLKRYRRPHFADPDA